MIKEVIDLALKGYKPDEIRELFKISNELEVNQAEATQEQGRSEGAISEDTHETDEAVNVLPETQKTAPAAESTTKPVDYKKLYEDTQAELKKAQAANINQNVQKDTPNEEETLKSMVRTFM